jgi:hypothetical protein
VTTSQTFSQDGGSAALGFVAMWDVIGSLAGVGGVVVAVAFGVKAQRASRRAESATQQAEAAKQALVRVEHEREHERLGPGPVQIISAELVPNPRGDGLPQSLFGAVSVPRAYRVQADVVWKSGGRSRLGIDNVVFPGRKYRFEIEKWPTDRTEVEADHVLFRFWAPAKTDDAGWSSCPCDRPMVEGDNLGHWEWRAQVLFPTRSAG